METRIVQKSPRVGGSIPSTFARQQAVSFLSAVVPARASTSHGARAVEINIEDHLTDAELFELAVCRWMDRRRVQ